MKKRIFGSVILLMALMMTACNATEKPPQISETPVDEEATPLSTATATATLHPTVTVTSEPEGSSLTALQNAAYRLEGCALGEQTFTLTNGNFTSDVDPSAVDYVAISLAEPVAFGDLNYDGIDDAAVPLAIHCGGSGIFVYLAAMINVEGKPTHVATVYIDDRPMINTLEIVDGEIRADTVLHGSADPMCCPTVDVQQGYRLYGNDLVVTYRAGETPSGSLRTITITSPADLETARYPFTVNGSVSIGPFENTLAYNVYSEDNIPLESGSVMTDSAEPGAPGIFSLPVDLSMAGIYGWVRVEFAEYSMMDGSLVTLDSVLVNVAGE